MTITRVDPRIAITAEAFTDSQTPLTAAEIWELLGVQCSASQFPALVQSALSLANRASPKRLDARTSASATLVAESEVPDSAQTNPALIQCGWGRSPTVTNWCEAQDRGAPATQLGNDFEGMARWGIGTVPPRVVATHLDQGNELPVAAFALRGGAAALVYTREEEAVVAVMAQDPIQLSPQTARKTHRETEPLPSTVRPLLSEGASQAYAERTTAFTARVPSLGHATALLRELHDRGLPLSFGAPEPSLVVTELASALRWDDARSRQLVGVAAQPPDAAEWVDRNRAQLTALAVAQARTFESMAQWGIGTIAPRIVATHKLYSKDVPVAAFVLPAGRVALVRETADIIVTVLGDAPVRLPVYLEDLMWDRVPIRPEGIERVVQEEALVPYRRGAARFTSYLPSGDAVVALLRWLNTQTT